MWNLVLWGWKLGQKGSELPLGSQDLPTEEDRKSSEALLAVSLELPRLLHLGAAVACPWHNPGVSQVVLKAEAAGVLQVLRQGSFSWFCYLILHRLPGVVATNPFLSWAHLWSKDEKNLCCGFNGDFTILACKFELFQGLGHGLVWFKQLWGTGRMLGRS